jgi:hypothetical protein
MAKPGGVPDLLIDVGEPFFAGSSQETLTTGLEHYRFRPQL